ncbi:ATP-binding protein [Demequina aurantiaca]|uniref:sensor histidine kinase n=1 Tax=Demequina aurantiaca TaxID=676200 RepID=UPI003D34AA11
MLVSLVALSAFGIALTGVVAYAFISADVTSSIDAELRSRTEAFYALADGADPATGLAWTDPTELVRAGVQNAAASDTTSAVGFVAGEARFVPASSTHLALEDDPEFLEVAGNPEPGEVTVETVVTDTAEYRAVSIPVQGADGSTEAVFTVATDHGARMHELGEIVGGYVLAAVLALVFIAVVAWVIVGRLLVPIRLLDEAARDISESDLTRRIPIVGNDDLARLSETVNAMLERIERAFAAQRNLLDDAGHELRTPLAVMRTSLDLLEPRDSEQVEQTQAMMQDEVAMMSRLVDDLVVLAKADRPEFVDKQDFDLGALTDAVLQRARALSDREWRVTERAEAPIHADSQRLQQAWMQLVANAVKFSDAATPISIGSTVDGEWVRLSVSDAGRGIAREDHERVLERFQRVGEDSDGAGLGLPIVSAIALAHGGRVELDSEVGKGSTFTIVIPVHTPGEA